MIPTPHATESLLQPKNSDTPEALLPMQNPRQRSCPYLARIRPVCNELQALVSFLRPPIADVQVVGVLFEPCGLDANEALLRVVLGGDLSIYRYRGAWIRAGAIIIKKPMVGLAQRQYVRATSIGKKCKGVVPCTYSRYLSLLADLCSQQNDWPHPHLKFHRLPDRQFAVVQVTARHGGSPAEVVHLWGTVREKYKICM